MGIKNSINFYITPKRQAQKKRLKRFFLSIKFIENDDQVRVGVSQSLVG